MHRTARSLILSTATTAATVALLGLLAPAAHADPVAAPGPSTSVLHHLSHETRSTAPGVLSNAPWLGRKL